MGIVARTRRTGLHETAKLFMGTPGGVRPFPLCFLQQIRDKIR